MNFIFPNEAHTTWTMMIVLYPYITGLVAGAFILSSLYHVFGRNELRPVARFSLVSAFAFLLFAPVPLLNHLGRPERAFNIMITPNFTSAMAGFGFIYATYLVVVALEIWFVFRSDFIKLAQGTGPIALLARLVTFNNFNETEATRKADHKISTFLAAWGIPHACLLHGYVGFLFGSVKANIWWSTPLMGVIFIFSAIVSGIALLLFGYFLVNRINKWVADEACVKTMTRFLWGFMMIAVALELLEVISVSYKQTEEWHVISNLISHEIVIPYVIFQFLIFSFGPFLLLAIANLFRVSTRVAHALAWTAAGMLLVQVALMRWNVVAGGQMVSKSFRGFTDFEIQVIHREGVIGVLAIMAAPFVVMWVFNRFVPLFETPAAPAESTGKAEGVVPADIKAVPTA